MNGKIIQGDLKWQKKQKKQSCQEPQQGPLFDSKAFGRAVKAKRTARKETQERACEAVNISQRFLANIENVGQSASVQVICRLANRYEISMNQFFFPEKSGDKSATRQQLDLLLDCLSEDHLSVLLASAEQMAKLERKASQNEKTE